ncbi:MAG: hypothetical protein AAF685_17715 [Cyanobacteria bacterium P01_C01_bin.89]
MAQAQNADSKHVDAKLVEQAEELKEQLLQFVMGAEGKLAQRLEEFTVERSRELAKSPVRHTLTRFVLDEFLTGELLDMPCPIEQFIEANPSLSDANVTLIRRWKDTFLGIFVVKKADQGVFTLRNWMTDFSYDVVPTQLQLPADLERLAPKEVVISRLSPLDEDRWIFSGPMYLLGALSKPKLAMAIANLKRHHGEASYGGAPELLEEAWESVASHHQSFLDYFGSDTVTLPGRQLNHQLKQFQDHRTQAQMEQAHIEEKTSLRALVQKASETNGAAGVDLVDVEATAEEVGVDLDSGVGKVAQSLSGSRTQLTSPQVEVPEALQRAKEVTALSDPQWGLVFIKNYGDLKGLIKRVANRTGEEQKGDQIHNQKSDIDSLNQALSNLDIPTFAWIKLANIEPDNFIQAMEKVTGDRHWNPEKLTELLKSVDRHSKAQLPEVANVPQHLNALFQKVLLDSTKKAKSSSSRKKKKGFKRSTKKISGGGFMAN